MRTRTGAGSSHELRKGVIAKNGDVAATVLVDGVVVGTWTYVRQGTVTTELAVPVSRTARREVEDEAARLEAWLR